MLIVTKQIRGEGRGHSVGFPTINLVVSKDLVLDEGIYAAWVVINGKTYKGALHYGSIPTFDLSDKTMEVHLIGINDNTVPKTENIDIEVDIVERIREVRKFADSDELAVAIDRDIKKINSILN